MAKTRKRVASFSTVLELAVERMRYVFSMFDRILVSFSGGKDSTVAFHIALQVARELDRLPLDVFFLDEEAIPYETEEYVRRVAQNPDVRLTWYCLPVKHRNACSRLHPWWSPWDNDEEDLWVRPLPPEAVTTLPGFNTGGEPRDRLTIPQTNGLIAPPTMGTVAMVMGIRAEESITRQRSVSFKKEDNYIIPYTDLTSQGNISKVYPIYDWKTADVWTAPRLFGWDYNKAYDAMDKCGVSPYDQRCSPAYGEEPLLRFHTYKKCFPALWDKMSVRVPGANAALLYARTEIYGFKDIIGKPDHMTWEAYVLNYVNKYAEQERVLVAKNIQSMINAHYSYTNDPILSEYDHPITGVSWRQIANIAMRGDFKGRRTSTVSRFGAKHAGRDIDEAFAAYHQARMEEGL